MEANECSLGSLAGGLRSIKDEIWGEYALSKDILTNRILPQERPGMIQEAIACGELYAARVTQQTGCTTPEEIAAHFQLKIVRRKDGQMGKRVLFAEFTPPNQIVILQEPIQKYAAIRAILPPEEAAVLPAEQQIESILLGHEIFHFLEEQYEPQIYTRTKKIPLWHIWKWKNESTVGALGEIAGMAFTKRLNHMSYSPFLLDVLLYFGYNSDEAHKIYQHMIDLSAANSARNW